YGMQLRHSEYDNNSKLNDVLDLAKQGRGQDINGYRSEFVRLVNAYNSL
ncbi:MAG: hypothetical protein CMC55_01000, partial [Flavobacteriaceae bacterium]|nr:hypothetical protein [Flavobacteriaceae bacterium]